MKTLGLDDEIEGGETEGILTALGTRDHINRPVASKPGLFFHVVLDRARSHLALARRKVLDVEGGLSL